MANISFSEDSFEEFLSWGNEDKKIQKKIKQLIKETLRTPFKGKGKPEPLKHDKEGRWSRRINEKDRLVYKFENNVLDLSNVGMERLFKCLKTILLAVVVLVALGLCPGGGGVLSDEVTLIAEAEENETNTITFVSEEGYILGEADKKEYSCQLPQGLTVMADLSFMSTGNRPGYVLVGWKIKDGDDKIYNVINGTNANGIENIMMYYPNQDTTFVAVWGKAYSVTFHSEEGYMQGNVEQKDYVIQVAEGKKINIFPYAAREGYAIAGVKTDDDETLYVQNYRMQEGTKSIFDYVLNGDVIFNVQWVKACDVTFKTKMGSFYGLGNNETTLQVECNETIGKSLSYDRPRVTECKGYKFVGWRIDGDNTLYRDMEYEDVDLTENEEHIWKYVVTKDVTFEAVWEEAYNVTFKMSSDNIGYDGESTSQIKKGDKIGKKSAGLISTYEEYIVTGWKIEGTDTIVDVKDIYQYIPTSDITFIPIWEKAFNVRFETYDGYFDDDESGFTIKVRQGENLTGKHIPTGDEGNDDGSIIVGYKIASDDTLFVMNNSNLAMGEKCIYEYIPTSDVTFIAQWK